MTNTSKVLFGFEKLDVHHQAIEFLSLSARICSQIPRGFGYLTDQLQRAALSIPANIAEGSGRRSQADQSRHFSIARGSAMECAAILTALSTLDLVKADDCERGRETLHRVVSMLSKMCR